MNEEKNMPPTQADINAYEEGIRTGSSGEGGLGNAFKSDSEKASRVEGAKKHIDNEVSEE